MALAMSAGSKNPEAAWAYMSFISSQKEQNATAVDSLPVWKTSYNDPQVIKTNPAMVAQAKIELNDMILRPQVIQYNAMSLVLQAEASKALIGQKSPQKALDDAASKAAAILKV
jgi:multiple sugar transport system substrate-binding protein